MSRASTISRAILEILQRAGDYALPEDQLCIELRGQCRPPVSEEEARPIIEALRARNAITYIGDDLDATLRKFLITETGKTLLARQP